jgi:hypothetical protein
MTQFNFRKTMQALCLLTVMMALNFTVFAAPPLIVADDVLTFSGGAQSPDNPDVYLIDMGNYVNGQTYSVTVNRPKGAQANYPVSIEYAFSNGDGFLMENGEILDLGVLEFAVGETSKTLTIKADDAAQLSKSQTAVYLLFGLGNRTKAQHPVVKMTFTNPNPVTPASVGSEPDLRVSAEFRLSFGSYIVMSMSDYSGRFFEALDNTRLRINRQYIDHEAYPATASDSLHAQTQSILLKPEEPAGTVTNELTFLYKSTEDAINNDYRRKAFGNYEYGPDPCFTRHADSIMNLQIMPDQTLFEQFYVDDRKNGFGDAVPIFSGEVLRNVLRVHPRFGAITADAASYDKGATIVLTIPVLNSKLMQKLFPGNSWMDNWMDNIDVTLDGGATFLDRAYLTFDGVNNNIIAIAEAKNETASPVTVTAEVRLSMRDEYYSEIYHLNI